MTPNRAWGIRGDTPSKFFSTEIKLGKGKEAKICPYCKKECHGFCKETENGCGKFEQV